MLFKWPLIIYGCLKRLLRFFTSCIREIKFYKNYFIPFSKESVSEYQILWQYSDSGNILFYYNTFDLQEGE